MEKGLKNLTQASRSAYKKIGTRTNHDFEDEPVEEDTVDIVRTENTADASTQTSTENVNESGRIKSEVDLSYHVNTGVLHPTITIGNDQVGAVRPLLQYENIDVYQREGWFRDLTPSKHAQDTRDDEIVNSLRAQEPKCYTISTTPGSLKGNECPSSEHMSLLSREQASGQLTAQSHNVPNTRDSTLHNECAKSETANPPKDSAHVSPKHLEFSTKKRTFKTLRTDGEPDPKNDKNDECDKGSRKRRRKDDRSAGLNLISPKRFACPYFKNDPFKDRSSRACSGPGFPTIAKLKYDLSHCIDHNGLD